MKVDFLGSGAAKKLTLLGKEFLTEVFLSTLSSSRRSPNGDVKSLGERILVLSFRYALFF